MIHVVIRRDLETGDMWPVAVFARFDRAARYCKRNQSERYVYAHKRMEIW